VWKLGMVKRDDYNAYWVALNKDETYDAVKNDRPIGRFTDLESAKHCCEASASRARPR
jgi:hypothetical protein